MVWTYMMVVDKYVLGKRNDWILINYVVLNNGWNDAYQDYHIRFCGVWYDIDYRPYSIVTDIANTADILLLYPILQKCW